MDEVPDQEEQLHMPDNSTSAGYLEMQKDHGAQYSRWIWGKITTERPLPQDKQRNPHSSTRKSSKQCGILYCNTHCTFKYRACFLRKSLC